MYIYYPSCNFSIASPSTAKVVRNLLKEKMVVAGCCLRDQREIHEDDIGVYFCQHCRETIENKVKTMSLWEYIDSLEDFDFPDYNHEKMLLQDCYRDRNHPEVHQAVRSILQKMNVDVVEAKRNKENSVYCGTLHYETENHALLEKLKAYPDVTLLFVPERKGKTAAMNRGMGFVTTPLVIFTDANTFINPQAVREIVKCFNHPQVGCVAGEKRVDMYSTEGAVSGGEGLYWKYESWLKKMDYQLYSAIGAAGELFAIRTPLYEEMPEDTLLDDFMLSLRIAMKQYTIAYCDTAYALESGSADMKEEEKRKVRIAAGGLQSVYRLKELLNPLRYGILSFQYVSHRVLRWSVTPVALFLLFPLNILLVVCSESLPVYFLFLLLQSAFYLGGVYGSLLSAKSVKNKFLYIPYYFLFMNINVIKGFFYLKRHAGGTWEKSRRA